MAYETALYPSGTCRSQRHSRLRCGSLATARRIDARIEAILSLLLSHPEIGVRTDDPSIRRINTSPYPDLIFYETGDEEIIIHAVRHGARDPSAMPGAP